MAYIPGTTITAPSPGASGGASVAGPTYSSVILPPDQIAALSAKNSSGFAYKLPSGDIIPPNSNPGNAAIVDIVALRSQGGGAPIPDYINTLADNQIASGLVGNPKGTAVASLGGAPNPLPASALPPATGGPSSAPYVAPGGAVGVVGGTDATGAAKAFPNVEPSTLIPAADLAAFTRANPGVKFTWEDLAQYNRSKTTAGAPTTGGVTGSGTGGLAGTPPVVGGVNGLTNNVQLNALSTKIDDEVSKIKAGIAATDSTAVLNDLFVKFGVKDAQDALTTYNQNIYDYNQKLKKLPEDIKSTLSAVGVDQAQLDRLTLKESTPIINALNDAMHNAGAAQDRINQSLTFVKMFADAKMADKAAQLEAMKFQLEQDQGKYKELAQNQKDTINLALEDQKNRLSLANDILKAGGDPTIINGATSLADAQHMAAPFFAQQGSVKRAQDLAPGIAAHIQTLDHQSALNYIKNQASLLSLDPNTLINMVEGESAKLLIQQETHAKSTTTAPLSILDIQRYQDAYPNAGIVAGDTQAIADAKANGTYALKGTDQQFTDIATQEKAANKTLDQVLADINSNSLIANKDVAIAAAKKVYGQTTGGTGTTTAPATPVYGSAGKNGPDLDARIAQLKNTLGDLAGPNYLQETLVKEGYPKQAIYDRLATLGQRIGTAISNVTTALFGK